MVKKIIISRPKMIADYVCPKCKKWGITGISEIKTTCKNCSTDIHIPVGINIYHSIAKKLIQDIAYDNQVVIQGERDASNVHRAKDLIKTSSRNDDDIVHTLLAIKKDFENMLSYNVSDVELTVDLEDDVHCLECGVCQNCVTCNDCGKSYVPKKVTTPHGKEDRYTCPHCKSKRYKQTHTKLVDGKCSECESQKVYHPKFSFDKECCPKCSGTKISRRKRVPVYRLTITRGISTQLADIK